MKPKKREEQYQSSRMYLREHDHRDVIMNNKYHNAIYMKKDGVDDVVWAKYPKRMVIGSYGNYFGNVDLEYGSGHYTQGKSGQRTSAEKKLDDCTIHINSYSKSTVWLTEDGVVWKRVGYNGGSSTANDSFPYVNNYDVLGKNTIGSVVFNSIDWNNKIYDLSVFLIKFIKDEETGEWTTKAISKTTRYNFREVTGKNMYPGNIPLVGRYGDDCIFINQMTLVGYSDTPNISYVWRMDSEGNIDRIATLPISTKYDAGGSRISAQSRYASNSSNTVSVHTFWGIFGKNWDWYQPMVVYTTTDGGLTWTDFELQRIHNTNYSQLSAAEIKVDLFYRAGKFHVYYADFGNVIHHWSSSNGTSWQEESLGNYVDIKLEGGFGSNIVQEPNYEYIRVKFNPSSEYNSDTYPNVEFRNAINYINSGAMRVNFDEGNYNMLFKDGKQSSISKENYLCCSLSGYFIYFDDCDLQSSSNSFALQFKGYNATNGAETIQAGDYCVGESIVEGELENG